MPKCCQSGHDSKFQKQSDFMVASSLMWRRSSVPCNFVETPISGLHGSPVAAVIHRWECLLAARLESVPRKCPKCGEILQRRRTLRGEELQKFLKAINRLGYPARPPPVAWQASRRCYEVPNESQESFGEFAKDDSQQNFIVKQARFPQTGNLELLLPESRRC